MVEPFCQEEALFQAALEIDAADQRAAYLDAACGDQRELRRRLEALLHRYAESSGPLDRAVCGLATTTDEPIREGPGTVLGRYKLIEQIGEGGFGVVFMAEQKEPVRRKVALKILKPGMDSKQVIARFEAEQQALALMGHPNIAQVLDAGETASGRPFFVMELVKGIPITAYCDKVRLPTRERLHLFGDLCQAVQHAHQKGVIHRDLKPSNVLITLHGDTPVVKVIDFGIAKAISQPLTERTLVTGFAQMIGTPLYMSPEQAALSGLDVDTRSDVYSLGVLLYELLTGTTPFDKETLAKAGHDELRRILREDEPPRPSTRLDMLDAALLSTVSEKHGIEPRAFSQQMRGELDWIVMKTLEKDRNRRYESASAFAADVQRYLDDEPVAACPPSTWYRFRKFSRRHKAALSTIVLVMLLLLLGGTVGFGAIMYRMAQAELTAEQQKAVGEQWVREHAIPHLYRLIAEKQYSAAFELAGAAERLTPGDPTLAEFWPKISSTWSVVSDPTGSDVYWKTYGATESDWTHLGQTPLDGIQLPRGLVHWKLTKEGYAAVEGCRPPLDGAARFDLYKNDAVPAGMVRVVGNQYRPQLIGLDRLDVMSLPDYFIDKYEVTNRQFKAFVDAGGYQEKVYWKQPFVKGKNVLSWEVAMKSFCDAIGTPGPAVWRFGTYPAGEDDYPVRGVSWYEAAAYAEFAEKSLPTVTHWVRASGLGHPEAEIVMASNFGRKGPAAVGANQGVGPFGTYDMAGNVKEWCWNTVAGDQRFLLGGGWEEPDYMFSDWDAQSPMERLPTYGFRCVKYLSDPIPEAAFAETRRAQRDYRTEKPVSDEQFRLIRTVYAYDKGPLNTVVISRKELPAHIHETVRFDAAYGTETVTAHLYLPRNVQPPYQTVIYYPGGWTPPRPYPQEDPPSTIAFLVECGRAVFCPMYYGTYERCPRTRLGSNRMRELLLQTCKDYFRSVDYIEQCTELDAKKLAYLGDSRGGWMGPMLLALDDRAKVAVFNAGGFSLHSNRTPFPEVTAINFAPRVTLPVLMLNGRNDRDFPLEINQRPLFENLGTPEKDKSHRLFDCGHNVPRKIVAQETLSWLDKYLGPVRGDAK